MSLIVEYLRPDGHPLRLLDLGIDFIEMEKIPLANATRPMRVEAEAKTSKAGNLYYDYEHSALPLPDGLETIISVGGITIPMEKEYLSARGHPTRQGEALISLDGIDYQVTAYITRGRKLYWVKVHAHKASKLVPPKQGSLSGGRIV